MDSHAPENCKDTPQLRVVQDPEAPPAEEPQVDLEEERKKLKEQAEIEDFWAGRNLADRIPTRRAA